MKIKNILLSSCLILAAFKGAAQSVSPKEEFKISISQSNIMLLRGSVDSVELTILRAKHFRGEARFNLSSPLPKGVSLKIHPISEKADHFIMRLEADAAVELKEFYVIPSCAINGKSKGVTLKVIVNETLTTETK